MSSLRAWMTPVHIWRLRLTFWTSGSISTSSAAPEITLPESPKAVRGVSAMSCSAR